MLNAHSIDAIMANKRKDMSKLRQMLRLYSQGESKLQISYLTGISRNTVKKYIKQYEGFEISMPELEPTKSKFINESDNLSFIKYLSKLNDFFCFLKWNVTVCWSSKPRELPPQLLTEPCLIVSHHTALVIQI